ncbi:hypothetical protein M5E87_02045 [Flavonifractor plautii]|nr:hypothetical protein M5E87_02045 [Flavonifractor plautii]
MGRTGDGDVRYSTYRNGRITFDDGDFNTLCRELTGTTLNYVRFELPDASEGRCITITETAATTARYPKAGTTTVPAAPMWTGLHLSPRRTSPAP